jgi:hypothetical protein
MKLIKLTASEVVDGKKVQLGEIANFPVPETLDDVLAMEDRDDGCNAEEIVACFNYGWKVKSQAKLRSGTDSKSNVSVFKKAGPDVQAKIMELAKEQGLL